MSTNITFIRKSEDYPEYKLGREADGHLVIYIGDETQGEWDWEDETSTGSYVVRDDGVDLDGDFETHCDDLAEEMRCLRAEAGF